MTTAFPRPSRALMLLAIAVLAAGPLALFLQQQYSSMRRSMEATRQQILALRSGNKRAHEELAELQRELKTKGAMDDEADKDLLAARKELQEMQRELQRKNSVERTLEEERARLAAELAATKERHAVETRGLLREKQEVHSDPHPQHDEAAPSAQAPVRVALLPPSPPTFTPPSRLTLLYASTFFGEQRFRADTVLTCPLSSSRFGGDLVAPNNVTVTVSYDVDRYRDTADGLVYFKDIGVAGGGAWPFVNDPRQPNKAALVPVPRVNVTEPRRNTRVSVWFTEEPPWYSAHAERNRAAMAQFQVFMGFNPNIAIGSGGWGNQVCYSSYLLNDLLPLDGPARVPWSRRREDYAVAFVQGNCREAEQLHDDGGGGGGGGKGSPQQDRWGMSDRTGLVRRLSQHVAVASLGTCLHNVDFPPAAAGNRAKEDQELRRFKFLFTGENSLCRFYMSEKVWKAYALGVVPIVYASVEALAALPAPDSYIDARSFPNAAALGEYVARMAANQTAYSGYHAWRRRPRHALNPGFRALLGEALAELEAEGATAAGYSQLCCTARGVIDALEAWAHNMNVPPLAGLEC